jgi:hypothetical protein
MDRSLLELFVSVSGSFPPTPTPLTPCPSREKELLLATLDYLTNHETAAINGEIPFQLELKVRYRC